MSSDAPQIASVCHAVFNRSSSTSILSFSDSRTLKEWQGDIEKAFSRKNRAEQACRQLRTLEKLQNAEALVKSIRKGLKTPTAVSLTAEQKTRLAQWQRNRCFVCVVAEEAASGQLVGVAALTLSQPEAILPPPFPTSVMFRAYCSNVAVLEEHRRRKIATGLLYRVERVARAWRHRQLWLHVDVDNTEAREMYRDNMNYKELSSIKQLRGLFMPPAKLMLKDLDPWGSQPGANNSHGAQNSQGVFVWR